METIIFLIIAGIFSTIFSKAKKNSRPKNKPFTANRFDDIRTLFETPAADPELPETPEKAQRGPQVWQEANLQDIEINYQQTKQVSEPDRVSKINSQSRMNKPRPKIKVEEIVSGTPDKNTVINGIIWSEILGEPRSKRPYSAKKR